MNSCIVKQAQYGMLFLLVLFGGCASEQAFTTAARPGETVMLSVGWKQQLVRNDLMVSITPQSGPVVTYAPGDSRIRTLIQSYPDPVSKLVVSDRAGVSYPQSGLANGATYNVLNPSFGNFVRNVAGQENDWSSTMVLIDLPTTLSPGKASIGLQAGGVAITNPISIEVLPGSAPNGPNNFPLTDFGGIAAMIRAAERAPHFTVRLDHASGIVPHSVQIDFIRTLAAEGKPWVTHGRGDIQNILWSDNGTLLKVIITPVNGITVDRLSDFKFYVTGAVTGITVNSVKAYDIAGNLLSGFNATTQYINN